jgi:hypothetical protein
MKHLLITILLFLSSVSLSHAGLFGPSNYEECVLENVKTAQTDRAVSVVMGMCLDKFPKKVIPVLPKLSKGMKADLVCTNDSIREPYSLTINPNNKQVILNKTRIGKITNITTYIIYGTVENIDKDDYEFFELHLLSGIFSGKIRGIDLLDPRPWKRLNPLDMYCSEEK